MEYIKFESNELNEFFKNFTGKEDFTIDDIIKQYDKIKLELKSITQKDLNKLSALDDVYIEFYGTDFSELEFEGFNYPKLKFFDCNINNTSFEKGTDNEVIINLNSCKGITTEQIEQWKNNSSNGLKFNIIEDLVDGYNINEFQAIISVMEEIKNSIPENSTELERVLFIHNILGTHIDYNHAGCNGDELCTDEDIKLTRSLLGTLCNGNGVCRGYALAFEEVCKYNDIEAESVSGKVHDSNGNGGDHAWNRVKVDGLWYYLDLTFDAKYQEKLWYCLKTEEEFSKNHTLEHDYEVQTQTEKSEKQTNLEDMFSNLFGENIEVKENDSKEQVNDKIYATESYNPEIVQQTMNKVATWTQLKEVLAEIEQIKQNNTGLVNSRRIQLSGITEAIQAVCLGDYTSTQGIIKQEERGEHEIEKGE